MNRALGVADEEYTEIRAHGRREHEEIASERARFSEEEKKKEEEEEEEKAADPVNIVVVQSMVESRIVILARGNFSITLVYLYIVVTPAMAAR